MEKLKLYQKHTLHGGELISIIIGIATTVAITAGVIGQTVAAVKQVQAANELKEIKPPSLINSFFNQKYYSHIY